MRVVVRAAEPPERTTSVVAGAMCGLSATGPDDPATRWTELATTEFLALAARPGTGVHMLRGRLVSNWGDAPPPWAAALPGTRRATRTSSAGYRVGFWVELPFADMPVYLAYLADRSRRRGRHRRDRPGRRPRRARDVRRDVVNCTGVGARDLVPDPLVRAVKGQHVVVENPASTSSSSRVAPPTPGSATSRTATGSCSAASRSTTTGIATRTRR
jgi:D-amino-acid oxidase